MNIAKLLLPLTMLLAIGGTNVSPALADNQPITVIADRGCYDNYMCPGSQRRYPYWVPRQGYAPYQCGQRRYRHFRYPQYRHQNHRRHHHRRCY